VKQQRLSNTLATSDISVPVTGNTVSRLFLEQD